MKQTTAERSQLFSIIIVFFFWGFIAASNGIFIPFCKNYFSLTQFQSQLIDLTFYGGYFIGSLLLFLFSLVTKIELLNRIGYKKGIIYGLIISAIGAGCIVFSVQQGSYAFILASYFLVALGFSVQQTCAQPFVIALGTREGGATRLNLAGGINSLGTTLAPILISYILFGSLNSEASEASLNSITGLYIGVVILFLLMAFFFYVSKLPSLIQPSNLESGMGALQYPQLVLGMVAIFIYVGVEVTIQSNMGTLLQIPEFGSYNSSQIAPFISLYWGSLMIGRWTNATAIFNFTGIQKIAIQIIVPYLAFGLILLVNTIHGSDVSNLYIYILPIALMIVVNFVAGEDQSKSLLYFSLFGLSAMLVGLMTTGSIAIFAFITGGLACSVLWPCIFSLALTGLGKFASQGSAFLIMMILGGAIIPPLQGYLADMPTIGIHGSYWVTVACFLYLAYYAIHVRFIFNKQGMNITAKNGFSH